MYILRPMHSRDVSQVMQINRQCFSAPWSAMTIKIDFEHNDSSHWLILDVASDSPLRQNLGRLWGALGIPPHLRQVIGFGTFWQVNGEAHIASLAVAPAYQGLGLGELLLWGMLNQAQNLEGDFSSLEVRVSNERAIRLYEKYGYQIMGRRIAYYHDNNEDAYLMTTPRFDAMYQQMLKTQGGRLGQRLHWRDDYFAKQQPRTPQNLKRSRA